MAACSPDTRALAQAVAAVSRAVEVLDAEGDDAAYEARHATIMLEAARVKHISRRHVAAATFSAEVEAAGRLLKE